MKLLTKPISLILIILMFFIIAINAYGLTIKETELELNGKSAILIDASTGTVLYEKNADVKLFPASVTKIMTLLLVFEAIEEGKLNYDDIIATSENAASMGGSQIFLEPGEKMSVMDLIKSVVIASANDAALTLAEHVMGSEEEFVNAMNEKAELLGMKNTNFENVTGLDDNTDSHLTTARDIAIMSRELLKYEKISEFTTIWMDTIRNGQFGLTNTNRLIRFYKGITGLKTGSTSKAGFCISASAKRNDTHLIGVIMGAESSDLRNASVAKLLDFGFANYSTYTNDFFKTGKVTVYGGKSDFVETSSKKFEALVNKGNEKRIDYKIELNEYVDAPVKKGDVVGKVIYLLDGVKIGENPVVCDYEVEKIEFWEFVGLILRKTFLK